jgi:hypothetical protein
MCPAIKYDYNLENEAIGRRILCYLGHKTSSRNGSYSIHSVSMITVTKFS